jgi:hypothetical protein
MKLGLAGLAGAALLVAAVAQADVFITDYYGFSWETTPSGQYVPLQSGNTYDIDGVVDAILAPLTSDFQHNQYTFAIQGGVQNGPAAVVGSGVDFRGAYTEYQVGYFDGANFSVYEDPLAGGTSANWGVNPPNATSPSTFVDGSPYLTATTRNWASYINVYTNGQEIGSFEMDLTFTGGTHVGEVGGPGTTGYSFAGLTKNPHASIPTGYKERIDGQQFVTPVQPSTWGAIKKLYAKN